MKVRYALVAGLILVLAGAVSIVGLAADVGVITASIATVCDVSFTSVLAIGAITAQYDGTNGNTDGTGPGFLELLVESNKDYTVQLQCSGNLGIGGAGAHWRDQLETEYAIWKQVTWHDAIGADGPYDGWVDDVLFNWYTNPTTVTWFEADDSLVDYRDNGKNDDDTNPNDFQFMAGNYLPEHYEGFTGFAPDPVGWQDEYYNYGADLTLRFFPCLSPNSDYGTRAGNYSGSITVTVTNVNP